MGARVMRILNYLALALVPGIATVGTATDQFGFPARNVPARRLRSGAALAQTKTGRAGRAGTAWWSTCVFYQVFVRSFSDSRKGPQADDGIGDLEGLIARLDYLNDGDSRSAGDLGVTGIWLMPVMESPSYHGYDIADHYTVNKEYGSNEDFKRLVDAAHRRGIHVVVDLVLNHVSIEHRWFQNGMVSGAPHEQWFLWADKKPGYASPWGQPVWHSCGRRWYYALFSPNMPDLNLRNADVTEEMFAVARFWLRNMQADGFRLDAVRHLIEQGPVQQDTRATHAWLRGFSDLCRSTRPDVLTIGEVWADTDTTASYLDGQMDLVFHFELAEAIISSVNSGTSSAIESVIARSAQASSLGSYAAFLSNHDQNRVMSRLGGDVDKAKLAATILLTGVGVPFIYYGEEIGMAGQKPDSRLRTPMQWTSERHAGFSRRRPWQTVNPDYRRVNVQAEAGDPDSLLNWYRRLIHLRNRHAALQVGDYKRVDDTRDDVYAFIREAEDEAVLVLVNLGATSVSEYSVSVPGGFRLDREVLHGGEVAARCIGAGDAGDLCKPIDELAPRTAYVIQLSPNP